MGELKDNAVLQFIEKVKLEDYDKYEILIKIRDVVFENYPNLKERMMYGGIMFYDDEEYYCGIFVYQHHVNFGFNFGFKFNDPDKLLKGDGKYRRHLILKSIEDIEKVKVDFFVKQIKAN